MYMPIKRRDIDQAIEPQIQQLIERIKEAAQETGFVQKVDRGIVVIGGGSLLSGLMERLGQEMKLPISMAQMNGAAKKGVESAALFCPSFGLAQSIFKRSSDYLISSNSQTPWAKRLMSKLADVYQEYF